MKIFKMGLDGGKPAEGITGVQPEWFYKGGGDIVTAPEQALPVPDFAEDAGKEPELVGVNLIGPSGQLFVWALPLAMSFPITLLRSSTIMLTIFTCTLWAPAHSVLSITLAPNPVIVSK